MIVRNTHHPVVRGAFTLMELMVVVAILVVLAGVGGYYYQRSLDDAKISAAKAQLKILSDACQAYSFKHSTFPDSLNALTQSDDGGRPYLDDPTKLNDPWGQPYQYNPQGPNNNGAKPDIWANGPTGQIGNWPGAK